jgi:mRNA degradation ribonuclease J1/J2
MAFAEHKKLEIKNSDMVIVSATAIPGNEKACPASSTSLCAPAPT